MKNVIVFIFILLGIHLQSASFLQLDEKCSKGHMPSCFQLGMMFESGETVRLDYAEARRYFKQACSAGHTKACIRLGDIYEREIGVDKNLAKARSLYEKACHKGDGEGCYYIARLEENNHHINKAVQRYDQACRKKFAMACSSLGIMYDFGRRVKKNATLARKYYSAACKLDKSSCSWLGNAYENAKLGVKQDDAKARYYYDKACKGNNAEGCYKLGNFYYYGKSIKKS